MHLGDYQAPKSRTAGTYPIIAALFGVTWIFRHIWSKSNIYKMHTIKRSLQRAPPNQNTIPTKLIRFYLPQIN